MGKYYSILKSETLDCNLKILLSKVFVFYLKTTHVLTSDQDLDGPYETRLHFIFKMKFCLKLLLLFTKLFITCEKIQDV